jgi:stearoyl-CoA desaturase (delta-9 desaturase)
VSEHVYPVRGNKWGNILFFLVTTLGGLVAAPIYLLNNGISISELVLFLFFVTASAMSITVGYHRLFAHKTFKANPVISFLLLFFGAAAFEQSALEWSSQHRDHHRYVDTDKDPYSINRGFFYAHIGWLIFWKHSFNFDNAKDLQKDALLMHQHRYYLLWAIGAGILTPLLLGLLTGHLLGALLISVCLRLTLVYHATFFINSICHMYGAATYDIHATARDNFLIAFLTFGEGFHNFHHRFPGDYRNGVRWYQWDPSKWLIALLEKLGLVSSLKRVSQFRIMRARFAGEHKRIDERLSVLAPGADLSGLQASIEERYDSLKANLARWETAAREYASSVYRQVAQYSGELRVAAKSNLREARQKFKDSLQEWNVLLARYSAAA